MAELEIDKEDVHDRKKWRDIHTYLGVILDEHMTFTFCIESRYTSGSKSLSSIISKYNVYGNMICILNYMMHVLFQQ